MEEPSWRVVDPENHLVITTDHGEIHIEMAPRFAPKHVARIKALARDGFYDGLAFHRVIDDFMAQGGDPVGNGTGGSDKPDLPAEFTSERNAEDQVTHIGELRTNQTLFFEGFKIGSQPDATMNFTESGTAKMWLSHCPGTAAMARSNNPDSANSQFYLTLGDARFLDTQYTAWGQIRAGQEHVEAIKKGVIGQDAGFTPDKMLSMKVAADLPKTKQQKILVMNTDSAAFKKHLEKYRKPAGHFPDICEISVPVQLGGSMVATD